MLKNISVTLEGVQSALNKVNDNLIMYLNNGEESSADGGGSLISFVSRKMLMINPVNIKIYI